MADGDYRRLLSLRTRLRGFLQWSEQQAADAGLSPSQHQLLLAVRGHEDPRGPTIGELADYLLLRHHSVVGLVDRAAAAGLVRRVADDRDGRLARVRLTGRGGRLLQRLSAVHLDELGRLAAHLQPLLAGLEVTRDDHGGSRTAAPLLS